MDGWEVPIIWLGRHAVSLFFVLSGFILSYHYTLRKTTLKRYFLHRALRIYPMLFFAAAAGATMFAGNFNLLSLSNIFLPQVMGVNSLNLGVMGWVLWSIPLELLMYLLLPALLALIQHQGEKSILNLLIACNVLLFIGTCVTLDVFKLSYHSGLARAVEFLCGVAAGSYLARTPEYIVKDKIIAPMSVLVVILFSILVTEMGSWDSNAVWTAFLPVLNGLVFAHMLLVCCASSNDRDSKVSQLFASIGKLSFSIYLLHGLVITLLINWAWRIEMTDNLPLSLLLTGLLLALPITLMIAAMTYHAIEKPFLALRDYSGNA
jgi:peptidoglycan/LPS O-acetylase OafA/YrhL